MTLSPEDRSFIEYKVFMLTGHKIHVNKDIGTFSVPMKTFHDTEDGTQLLRDGNLEGYAALLANVVSKRVLPNIRTVFATRETKST